MIPDPVRERSSSRCSYPVVIGRMSGYPLPPWLRGVDEEVADTCFMCAGSAWISQGVKSFTTSILAEGSGLFEMRARTPPSP